MSATHESSPKPKRARLVPRHKAERFQVVRIGQRRWLFRDLYVNFLLMPWSLLLVAIAGLYLASNLVFALIYHLDQGGIENAQSFTDLFFFSVQTMATIGYGRMYPTDFLSHTTVTIEAFWGFTFFAFVTGLSFAKFSRPTAHILFSDVAVISGYNDLPHLKIRLTNQRHNRIVDAHIKLFLLRNVTTTEGYTMRQFYDLPLTRNHVPLLALTWTVLHPIDEHSPLFGLTEKTFHENGDEIIVALTGRDETLAQTVNAQYSYFSDEVIFGAFFEDILTRKEDRVEINYNLFHATRPHERPESTL